MTQRHAAVVLYEDQRGRDGDFAFHDLLVACIADALGCPSWTLNKRFDPRPLKGIGNLEATCRDDGEQLCNRHLVFVVVDADRIRKHLELDALAPDSTVIATLKSGWFTHERLHYHLLQQNLETVVRAAGDCDESLDRDQIDRALRKKLFNRDSVFARVAKGAARQVRDCVKRRVPSLAELVDAVAAVVRPTLG